MVNPFESAKYLTYVCNQELLTNFQGKLRLDGAIFPALKAYTLFNGIEPD